MSDTKSRLAVLGGLILLGLLVIFQPSLFYFSESKDELNPRHRTVSALTEQFKAQSFDANIQRVTQQAARHHNRLAELKRKQPWTGETPIDLAMAIRSEEEALHASNSHLTALTNGREELMTQIRALTPVFSKMAWEEARELYTKKQENWAGSSYRYWKWDMMFDMLFGGMGREDNIISYALSALVRLLTQLSFGSIIAAIDFTFCLPFWLKEYQLYTPEDFMSEIPSIGTEESNVGKTKRRGATEDDDTGAEDDLGSGAGNDAPDYDIEGVRAINSGGGWKSTLSAIAFWVLALIAACTATGGLILLIWTPMAAIFGFIVYKAKQERERRGTGGGNYQTYRRRDHYD